MEAVDQKVLDGYFRLNVEKKLASKVPDQDDTNLTPATRLLEKRREMLEVESGLNTQKEEFQKRMDALAERTAELAAKEASLKESLVKFDKFLKENDSKRNRALKKANDERKMREAKEAEIQRLNENLAMLTSKKEKQDRTLESLMAYQRYLELVVEAVEDFGEMKDIIARYDTLVATNSELLVRAQEAQEKSEVERALLGSCTEDKNNVILAYNNEMANLQTTLEEIQARSAKWQAEWDRTVKNASQKSLLLGQIKMATNNLFNVMKFHLNNRLNNTTETSVQLEKIQQFMLDLTEITDELKSLGPQTPSPNAAAGAGAQGGTALNPVTSAAEYGGPGGVISATAPNLMGRSEVGGGVASLAPSPATSHG